MVAQALRKLLADGTKRRVLVDVDPVRLHRVNLDLLSVLLDGERNGLLVAMERPACYVLHQLRQRGIGVDGLWAVDLLTGVSCPTPTPTPQLIVAKAPFTYDLPHRLKEAGDRLHALRPRESPAMDFLLVDNLSSLDYYIAADRLDLVVRYLEEMLARSLRTRSIIPVDLQQGPAAARALRDWCDTMIPTR